MYEHIFGAQGSFGAQPPPGFTPGSERAAIATDPVRLTLLRAGALRAAAAVLQSEQHRPLPADGQAPDHELLWSALFCCSVLVRRGGQKAWEAVAQAALQARLHESLPAAMQRYEEIGVQ